VFYHDKCFDGACSAALFSASTARESVGMLTLCFPAYYTVQEHSLTKLNSTAEENAIVDFKYSSSPKITWWFDHHESAFLSPEMRHTSSRIKSNRKFYDPDFKSCTSFIAMIAQQRFGFDPAPVAELVHWADVIDGALYADAKTAVEMAAPAMK